MLEGLSLTVEEGESGIRLDRFLRSRFPGLPSRSVRFAIEAGEVKVEGEGREKAVFSLQGRGWSFDGSPNQGTGCPSKATSRARRCFSPTVW